MCSVPALIGFQVASGTLNYFGGRQQAKSQRSFQRKQEEALIAGSLDQEAQLAVQGREAQEEVARQKMAASREARRARASAIVQQVEQGRGGQSAAREVQDLFRQESEFQEALTARGESLEAATEAQLRGLKAQTLSQQNQILAPVSSPSLLGSVLGIGSSVAQTMVMKDAIDKKGSS